MILFDAINNADNDIFDDDIEADDIFDADSDIFNAEDDMMKALDEEEEAEVRDR